MLRLSCLVLIIVAFAGNALCGDVMDAKTSNGKRVLLKPDGTWVFAAGLSESAGDRMKPDADRRTFRRPSTSTKVAKSLKGFYEIWYDRTKWTSRPPTNPMAEFEFRHRSGDAYAVAVAERLPMPIATLKEIAVENAKAVASDLKVLGQGQRMVNGSKVAWMKMKGTVRGIKLIYYGYYWSGAPGTLQLVTYTGQNLFQEFRKDFDDLLNGLVIIGRRTAGP